MNFVHSDRPRYVPNTSKAVEVILWLADRHQGIDVYHLVKAAFFADKWHVSEYGRPLAGDVYEAAPYGPLPKVVYGLLRHEPLEVLAAGGNGRLPFRVSGDMTVSADRHANLRRLSESDQEALEYGLSIVRDKSFDDLYQLTHDDLAYINADGGIIDYRDLIPENDPQRAEKAQDLCDVARFAVF